MPELRDYISTPFVTYDGWYNNKTEEPFDLSQPIWEDTDIYLKYTQHQQAAEEEYATEEASILRYAPLAAVMVLGVQPKGGQTWENQNRSTFVMS